ncbi:hypothetical protein [Stieleria marina]|uniref:Uncharacterized protein n=1 Tax=Stieleria marina TaxID=1930275 RepID=A0A517P3F1_9BACT|nr:hypothetical protein K239x_59240 [Planctomycetes bacterium K23_9]
MTDATHMEPQSTSLKSDKLLLLYLRLVGYFTLLAFAAAVMPERWMIDIAQWLTIDPFPEHPLTFYLARNLSLLYGFVGIGLLVIANDIDRYRPMVRMLAYGTIAFGVLQIVCDLMSAMPWWWSWGEGAGAIMGGSLIYWLDARARREIDSTTKCLTTSSAGPKTNQNKND